MFTFMCCFSDDSEYMKKNIDKIHDTHKNIDIELKQSNNQLSDSNDVSNIKVCHSQFSRIGYKGDFLWEIKQNIEPKTLYIFNDNENDHPTAVRGGGNAVIRPFNRHGYKEKGIMYPRSAGISTGDYRGGYQLLSRDVKEHIDECIKEIKSLLSTGNYDTIKYSSCDDRGSLGTGIFRVCEDVKEYIVDELKSLKEYNICLK